jgi:translation initiation factor IF-2
MSEEQKKPKVTLIKHKKSPAPPIDTKRKDETEKKKIVVVKKKKVVVKKTAAKKPQEESKPAAPAVERVRLQDKSATRGQKPNPTVRDRQSSRERVPSRVFRPKEGEAGVRRPARTPRKPAGFTPAKQAPPPKKEEAAKPAGKKFFKSKKKDTFAKAREKFEEHQEKLFTQAKKKAMQRANPVPKEISIMENVSVSELARKMNLKAADLISKLMSMGMMVTMNEQIDSETAAILAEEYDCKVNVVSLYDETIIEKEEDREEDMSGRPPIVTVMGHVDHGKTKLLDAIRATNVVDTEFGGITQHIGAYSVEVEQGKIVFLDTPGHEAFTTMRARGAQVTDIVVLVVAADDGVMPQTEEAVSHAKEAKVPIIVAINKIDLAEANPDRVKQQLSERDLMPEDWGGHTQYVELSALKRTGIKELLDAILLQAEILELKANYNCRAEGKIVESKIDFGRGNVATVLIQRGTLKVGDPFVAGVFSGKVRAMFDDKGEKVEEATPSIPVEILGFAGIPNAGDPFQVTESEKEARQIGDKRQELRRLEDARNVRKITLDNIYEQIKEGEQLELKVIIKGDVHGSVEALSQTLERLSTPEIRLNVIHASAGAINERDVMLASASNAIIVGFNVRPTPSTQALADQEKVEIRKYNVIYEVVDDIKAAMEGLLAPEISERTIGTAEVRDLFKVPKIGVVAGCYVTSGKVRRNATARVLRDGREIYAAKLSSLKRFKDDAREVEEGYECGIGIENFNDIKVGDIIEAFEQVEMAKTLESVSSDGGNKTEEG